MFVLLEPHQLNVDVGFTFLVFGLVRKGEVKSIAEIISALTSVREQTEPG